MADELLQGSVAAAATPEAILGFDPIESFFWRWADLGSVGDKLEETIDDYGGVWKFEASDPADAPATLQTYSSVLCLEMKQQNAAGAYDWWSYPHWIPFGTSFFRIRVTGYFTDSSVYKSLRFRLRDSSTGEVIGWQLDGDRMEIRSSISGRLWIQTGYNDGPFTFVGEIYNNRVKAKRVNSINESLSFDSWEGDAAYTFNAAGKQLAIAIGNDTPPVIHGYVRTIESFFDWGLVAGTVGASSSVSATLQKFNLAGEVQAASAIAGLLGLRQELAAAVAAQSSVAGDLTELGFELSGALRAQAGAIGRLRGGTPIAVGPLRLLAPDGAHEIRRVPFDWLRPGQAYTQDLELEAPEGHPNPVLWTDRSGWLEVQVAGGPWKAVGSSRASGASLGTFSAGQRKTITFRVRIPGGTEARGGYRVSLPLNLEVGT